MKIFPKSFGSLKSGSIFVVPNSLILPISDQDIFKTAKIGRASGCCSTLVAQAVWRQKEVRFFYCIYLLTQILHLMPNSKNLTEVANKSTKSRQRSETPYQISLTLTGVKNPYLYAIRKSFAEFLQEETRDIISSDLRLSKKIEAARMLFPEARQELRRKTVKTI